MTQLDVYVDWPGVRAAEADPAPQVDSKRRTRLLLAGFLLAGMLILSRSVQIYLTQGADFRRFAAQPMLVQSDIPATRGRILARDGTVLAAARPAVQLFVHYRWLEEPANEDWLRRTARSRLAAAQRKDAVRLAAEMARVRVERTELHRRLAALIGVDLREWNVRRQRIQDRVERISDSVNRRRLERVRSDAAGTPSPNQALWNRLWQVVYEAITQPEAPVEFPRVVVAEELDYHLMADDLLPQVQDLIAAELNDLPGVEIRRTLRREYPLGELAGNVLGHLGAIDKLESSELDGDAYVDGDRTGRSGLEQQYERLLHGRPGSRTRRSSRPDEVVEQVAAQSGADIAISLDVDLQRTAEGLLDSAIALNKRTGDDHPPTSGAAVVMDCTTGQLLAVASAPRFDPNVFERQNQDRNAAGQVVRLLSDPAGPMFDRATQMALPPGSLLKLATAAALLEEGEIKADTPFYCQGYLRTPQRHRCYIYEHYGVGHGDETLSGALAESCNVFFFHHAAILGPEPLVAWYRRFGLGGLSGVDLPHEASGRIPTPDSISRLEGHPWTEEDTLAIAVGQGSLTATPLQIARIVAAVANGGRLVTPRLLREVDGVVQKQAAATPIARLSPDTLAAIREGMTLAVSSPEGTAHRYLAAAEVPVAAKTGTAETDEEGMDHAWIAGYAPADAPRFVFVIALEHGGGGAAAAGPVARRLISTMERLGYFQETRAGAGLRTE